MLLVEIPLIIWDKSGGYEKTLFKKVIYSDEIIMWSGNPVSQGAFPLIYISSI